MRKAKTGRLVALLIAMTGAELGRAERFMQTKVHITSLRPVRKWRWVGVDASRIVVIGKGAG